MEAAWTDDSVRRAARGRLKKGIVRLFLEQARAEAAAAVRSRLSFRSSRNPDAVRAYCAMTQAEFEGINARQRWANWRTIPKTLRGRLPSRPCRALDLCSGAGHSTEVLAWCLPPGSTLVGLEFNPAFADAAAARDYRDATGGPARVFFRAQSVLDPFLDERGLLVAAGSVDVVNSSGALGLHFDRAALGVVADEISRVLRPGGLAAVDSCPKGIGPDEMSELFAARGFTEAGRARSCFLDRFTQLCLVKNGGFS
ncbi:MAG: class I SAM-dependent methyltransferase [Elusimicrobiota bacterium]|nr:MAG: class I SAM-dependent methyltransferase [Elusimicrobiota bacterium]